MSAVDVSDIYHMMHFRFFSSPILFIFLQNVTTDLHKRSRHSTRVARLSTAPIHTDTKMSFYSLEVPLKRTQQQIHPFSESVEERA